MTQQYDDNLFAVDTTGVQEMGGYEVLQAGVYPVIMIAAAKKATKNGSGAFLECTYQIIEGEATGKKYTSRLNLWNQNVQAVDIAKRELKSLRIALGLHDQEARTSEFINKPLVINLGVKAQKDDPTKPENNLVSIEPYGGKAPQPAAQQQMNFAPAPQQQYAQQPQQQYAAPAQQAYVPPGPHAAPPAAFVPNGAQQPPWRAAR